MTGVGGLYGPQSGCSNLCHLANRHPLSSFGSLKRHWCQYIGITRYLIVATNIIQCEGRCHLFNLCQCTARACRYANDSFGKQLASAYRICSTQS